MAQLTVVTHTDDLDGSPAVSTRTFMINGVTYSIDLSAENSARFSADMLAWTSKARRTGGRQRSTSLQGKEATRSSQSRIHAAEVREWARANNIDVSARGRISKSVLEQHALSRGA